MINSHLAIFFHNDAGQDLVEYSLLLSFLTLASMAILLTVGSSINTLWSAMNSKLTSAAS